MAADLNSLHSILRDSTRRKIISLLGGREPLSYVEILNLLEIEHTGKLNYHLKQLGDLVSKGEDGKYSLTEKGRLAVQVMSSFQPAQQRKDLLTFPLSRGGLGKLLLVAMVPLFILSLFPLSRDYLMATRASFVLAILAVLLLAFGLAHIVPNGRPVNGFNSFRQLVAYGLLELTLTVSILLISAASRFGSLPLISASNGNAFLVYLAVLPGGLAWLAVAFRLEIHEFAELRRVPLVASGLLLAGGLVLSLAASPFAVNANFMAILLAFVMEALPIVLFLFTGVIIMECAFRLVEWGGQSNH